VEEQIYLFFPWIFKFVKIKKFSKYLAGIFIVSLIAQSMQIWLDYRIINTFFICSQLWLVHFLLYTKNTRKHSLSAYQIAQMFSFSQDCLSTFTNFLGLIVRNIQEF